MSAKAMSTTSAFAIALLSILGLSGAANAADGPGYKTAGGLVVYLGVLPAAMIQGHSKDHAEQAMHRGIPPRAHAYHVMAAVFDAVSGERVVDATVSGGAPSRGDGHRGHRDVWQLLHDA
jgi:hypothetical protein